MAERGLNPKRKEQAAASLMRDPQDHQIEQAMAHLPSGLFVMTAAYEGRRTGIVVRSVQQCASEPPLVCVSMRKGHWVSPLIRDSHFFGLCKIASSERLLLKKFAEPNRPRDGDPFDCVPVEKMVSGSPILSRALAAMDCEVVRHLDLEADSEIFIGKVLAARVSAQAIGATSHPRESHETPGE